MKRIVLIPAYNPDDRLVELVKKINLKDFDIVVVDDGSCEKSKSVFKKIDDKCQVLHHEINKGKGVGIKTALSYIKEKYKDEYIVVTMDCDGQHLIEDAIKLCEYNETHLNTLCLGSRKFGGKVPIRSKVGNAITRGVFAFTTGVKIYDTQTGLRSFSNRLIDTMLEITGERFEYEINVLLEITKRKIPVKEITIKTIYIDNNSSSHFNAVTDSIKVYKEIFKFSGVSILSFLIDFVLYLLFLITFSFKISNILARVISTSFNFIMNKNYRKARIKSVSKYLFLALIILVLNTILLSIIVSWGINKILAKIIVEGIIFIMSYLAQKNFVFPTNID